VDRIPELRGESERLRTVL